MNDSKGFKCLVLRNFLLLKISNKQQAPETFQYSQSFEHFQMSVVYTEKSGEFFKLII